MIIISKSYLVSKKKNTKKKDLCERLIFFIPRKIIFFEYGNYYSHVQKNSRSAPFIEISIDKITHYLPNLKPFGTCIPYPNCVVFVIYLLYNSVGC